MKHKIIFVVLKKKYN